MSLYNMVCGNNPLFTLLHKVLETVAPLPEIPRYRDTYTIRYNEGHPNRPAGDDPAIVIYTRTGGGNREEYQAQNDALMAHPLFRNDWDDDFDSTFAHFAFAVPDEWEDRIITLHTFWSKHPKGMPPGEKFKMAMAALKNEPLPELPQPTEQELEMFSGLIMGMAEKLGLSFVQEPDDEESEETA